MTEKMIMKNKAILLIILCIFSTYAWSTEKNSMPGKANALAQAVSHWGVEQCVPRVQQVSNFVGFNQSSGALALMPPENADKQIIPVAIEVATESGSGYVSANFAPNQANGCGASYDAVVYWDKGCSDIAEKHFKIYKNIGALNSRITVLDGGLATKVFLMPAGSGCVSIKKEVVI